MQPIRSDVRTVHRGPHSAHTGVPACHVLAHKRAHPLRPTRPLYSLSIFMCISYSLVRVLANSSETWKGILQGRLFFWRQTFGCKRGLLTVIGILMRFTASFVVCVLALIYNSYSIYNNLKCYSFLKKYIM